MEVSFVFCGPLLRLTLCLTILAFGPVIKQLSSKNSSLYLNNLQKLQDDILDNDNNKTSIIDEKDIFIPGKHNVENFLAAILATIDYVSVENIVKVAKALEVTKDV